MNNVLLAAWLSLAIILCPCNAKESRKASRVVTSTSVTGAYRDGNHFIDVVALPGNKIKFAFYGAWPDFKTGTFLASEGPVILNMVNNKAVYMKEKCEMTIKFKPRLIEVTDNSEKANCNCELNQNIFMRGSYKKISNRAMLDRPERWTGD